MEGILGIFGIAVMVMEGVELFSNSSHNTLVAAGIACLAYAAYKWWKKLPEPTGKTSVKYEDDDVPEPYRKEPEKTSWPQSPHMDEYLKEYNPKEYDAYCDTHNIKKEPTGGTSNTAILDAIKYAKPTEKKVSEVMQAPSYTTYCSPALNVPPTYDSSFKRKRISEWPDKHLYMFHVCYDHFKADLTILVNTKFDWENFDFNRYPEWKRAFHKAGSPACKDICVASIAAEEKNGNRAYIPADLKILIKAHIGLEDFVNEVLLALNRYFGDTPCYYWQY